MQNEDIQGQVTPIDIQAVNPVPPEAEATRPPSPFGYIAPSPGHLAPLKEVDTACQFVYETILSAVPNCADRTLAIRALQEVRMWSNCAIVHDGKNYLPPPVSRQS